MSTRSDNDDSSVDRLEDGGEGVQESDQAQDRQDTHMEWTSSEDKDDKESNRNWINAGQSTIAVDTNPPSKKPLPDHESSVDQLEAGGEESVTSGDEDKPMVGGDAVAALVTEDKDDKVNSDKKSVVTEQPHTLAPTSHKQPPHKKPSPSSRSWSWNSYSQDDTRNYRDGYKRKKEGQGTMNAEFHQNVTRCQPDGMLIDDLHKEWWGDYRLLEYRHGYIQWLFPIREQGLNRQAQELNQQEIEIICNDEKALGRILTSYKMMLDFYGMELVSDTKGDIKRGSNWKRGFDNLNHSMHNYLRITRILKCLGEFVYEHLKAPFIRFVLREAIVERTLPRTLDSCKNYWIQVLKVDKEREEVTEYIKELKQEEKEKREKTEKRINDEKIAKAKRLEAKKPHTIL